MPLLDKATKLLHTVYLFTWDTGIAVANLIAPTRKWGAIVPRGNPGAGSKWPDHVAPQEGDSRCCCPALNALANHGIFPHDGRNIKFTEMTHAVQTSFNLSSTFSIFIPTFAADILHKDYKTGTFDLAELSIHNGIEHDGSFLRQDARLDPKQDKPYLPLVNDLLASATGKDSAGNIVFTHADLSRASGKRRSEARANNPEFTLTRAQKNFASGNCSSLLLVFGGRVADLGPFLREERIPQGWEPRIVSRYGLSLLEFNRNIFKVERAIKEEIPVVTAVGQDETGAEYGLTRF
ncbi:Chloroperoxidase [Mycena metata]|uniref:Chloroperoxidase n=1 Tax=Mycena metata TaxID=1033252 RepID=A0AAD7N2J2_9AGAR|nr:Chloroperoxidase [Mycena metata]